jgi:hypothetical protein
MSSPALRIRRSARADRPGSPLREWNLDVLVESEVIGQVILLEDKADIALVGVDVCPRLHRVYGLTEQVVLAAPDGPMIETNSPFATSVDTPRKTKFSPARLRHDFSML